jgi:uncharacterized protein (DUF1786 family)
VNWPSANGDVLVEQMGDGHLINAILASERAIEKARLLEHYLPRLRREAFKRRLPLVK